MSFDAHTVMIKTSEWQHREDTGRIRGVWSTGCSSLAPCKSKCQGPCWLSQASGAGTH